MTPAKFASYIRYKTRTNSTTLTDADLLILANPVKDEMCAELEELNEDLFIMRFYRDLVADQRVYSFPSSMSTHLKYVQAKLDGTNQVYLSEFDINAFRKPLDETNIRNAYSDRDPQYDINARSLKIFNGDAITDVTDGLILHATQFPQDISDLTLTTDMSIDPTATEFGIPKLVHRIWATRVIIEYKESKDKPIPLTGSELYFDRNWEKIKNSIKGGNLDRAVVPTEPKDDGQDY